MPKVRRKIHRRLQITAAVLVFCAVAGVVTVVPTEASGINSRSIQLGSAQPSANTSYDITFTIANSVTLGSVKIELCSNSPLEQDVCTSPVGASTSGAQLAGGSGVTDFTLTAPSANVLLYSHAPAAAPALTTVSLHTIGIVNPVSTGAFYAKVSLFDGVNGTGTKVGFGGVALSVNQTVKVSAYVPPYITMCTGVTITGFDCLSSSGDYINLGNLSSTRSSQATSQIVVATNADFGYAVQISGNSLTSGNNVIAPLVTPSLSVPGTSQFGVNLRANTLPAVGFEPAGPGVGQPATNYAQVDHFQFVSGDIIAASPNGDDYRKYTVSYLVNASASQAAGIYGTTITYVGVASF